MAAAATLALAAGARAQTTLLTPSPEGPVEVEADHIVYQWEAQIIRLEGHVVVRRAGGILRAGSGTMDRAHGILKLEGGVLGVQERQGFLADSAGVGPKSRSADPGKAGPFFPKQPPTPQTPP